MANLFESQVIPHVITYLKSLGYEYVESGYRQIATNRAPIYIDVIVFDNHRKPYIVVEVKDNLPQNLTKFHPAVDQAYRYARQLNAPFFLIADGQNTFWYRVSTDQQSFDLVSKPPRLNKLKEIQLQYFDPDSLDNLLFAVSDLLRGQVDSSQAHVTLSALLLAKVYDEEKSDGGKKSRFRVIIPKAGINCGF